jgi:hypothetical protein
MPKITINGTTFDAIPYSKMPQRGQDAPVPIRIDGVLSEAQVTRGGTPPMTYSYFRLGGRIHYIKGHMPYNAEIKT